MENIKMISGLTPDMAEKIKIAVSEKMQDGARIVEIENGIHVSLEELSGDICIGSVNVLGKEYKAYQRL